MAPRRRQGAPGAGAVIAIAKCETYEPHVVERAVSEVLSHLGGIGRFVRPGARVLLKPNLLSAKAPERAITTHPQVLEALIGLVRGAGGLPSVGDSPGGAIRGIERVWRNTGMLELSERTGVPLVNFEAGGTVPARGRLRTYHIARPVLDADVIISVPKMKTHILTLYTGCIKNMFGALPGFGKGRLHSLAPRPVAFARHVVDVYSLAPATLHIMDAVVAMEGDGPSGGRPRHVGAIFAGTDPVAVDSVASGMMGYRPGQVPVIRIAASLGLGVSAADGIEIKGERPEAFDLRGFVRPKTQIFNFIPSLAVKALTPFVWVYPEMSFEWGCVGEACGLCVRSCPVGAIEMTEQGPRVNRKTCVECLCCHEVCPEQAVRVRLSWLARRFA